MCVDVENRKTAGRSLFLFRGDILETHLIRRPNLLLSGFAVLYVTWESDLPVKDKSSPDRPLTAVTVVQHFNFYWYLLLCSPQLRSSGIHSECLDYNAPEHSPTGAHLSLFGCHGQGGNQVHEAFHTSFILSLAISCHLSPSLSGAHSLLSQSHDPSRPGGRRILKCQRFLWTPKTSCHSWFTPENCSLLVCSAWFQRNGEKN